MGLLPLRAGVLGGGAAQDVPSVCCSAVLTSKAATVSWLKLCRIIKVPIFLLSLEPTVLFYLEE